MMVVVPQQYQYAHFENIQNGIFPHILSFYKYIVYGI